MRTQFFFGVFYKELSLESEVEVFPAERALIPQIKVIMENFLHADISFAVVSNSEIVTQYFFANSVSFLEPSDECSFRELQAIRY